MPITHGMSHTDLHNRWMGILDRCKHQRKATYRGIKVCKQWQRFEPFRDWSLANGYKPELHIDRIDGRKGYSPENCRWVTRRQNQLNSQCIIWAEVDGERIPLRTACAKLGLKYKTVWMRVQAYGWSVPDALSIPIFIGRNGH